MIRDMMVYHSRQFADPQQQVQQARALLDFLAQNVPVENNPYGIVLKQELELLRTPGRFLPRARPLGGGQRTGVLPSVRGARGCARPAIPGGGRVQHDARFQFFAAGGGDAAQDRAGYDPHGAVHGLRAQSDLPADVAGPPGRASEPQSRLEEHGRDFSRLVGTARQRGARSSLRRLGAVSHAQRRDLENRRSRS